MTDDKKVELTTLLVKRIDIAIGSALGKFVVENVVHDYREVMECSSEALNIHLKNVLELLSMPDKESHELLSKQADSLKEETIREFTEEMVKMEFAPSDNGDTKH